MTGLSRRRLPVATLGSKGSEDDAMSRFRWSRFWIPFLFMLGAGLPIAAAGAEPYTLAILPGAPPITMHKLWTPVVDRLAKATGLEFRLKLYDKMAEFERDIWAGNPDFIFGSPISPPATCPWCAAARRSTSASSCARIRRSAASTT